MTRSLFAFGLTLTLTLTLAVPAAGQTVPVPVRAGDVVRVQSATAAGRFTVQVIADDALTLRDSTGTDVSVPLAAVTRLSVLRGPRSPRVGALRGAGLGLAVGAGTGILIGLVAGDDEPNSWFYFTAEEKATAYGVVLGASAGLLGGIIGLAAPGELWERVDPLSGVRMGVGREGGVNVGYALRF
jgi:hypothetical protein